MATFQSLEEAKAFFVKDRFATENNMSLEALTEDGAVCVMELTERSPSRPTTPTVLPSRSRSA